MTNEGSPKLTDPDAMERQLRDALIGFTLRFLDNQPERLTNADVFAETRDTAIALRDSVLYRFESMRFHVALIDYRLQDHLRELTSPPFRLDGLDLTRAASREMKFLFDDVVFSTLSLFDYFAKGVTFFFGLPRTQKLSWLGLHKWATGPGGARKVSAVIRTANGDWIQGLADYRNALIHEASDTAGGSNTHRVAEGRASVSVRITVPRRYVESIPYLREHPSAHELGVAESAHWLLENTFDVAVEMLGALEADLAR